MPDCSPQRQARARPLKTLEPFRSVFMIVTSKPLRFPPVKRKCSCEHEPVRHGQPPLAKRTIRSRISSECWEQIKTAYAAGIGLREIARKMNIPESTALAHAKRHGWTQQIQVATQQQSDAITPVQSVPQSFAAILSERKERTRLGLSQFHRGSRRTSGRASRQAGDCRKSERRGKCP